MVGEEEDIIGEGEHPLTRRRYYCRTCGQLKKGHLCPGAQVTPVEEQRRGSLVEEEVREETNEVEIRTGNEEERIEEDLERDDVSIEEIGEVEVQREETRGEKRQRNETIDEDAMDTDPEEGSEKNPKRLKKRAPYKCKFCGEPKKGHICTIAGTKRKRGEHEDQESRSKPQRRKIVRGKRIKIGTTETSTKSNPSIVQGLITSVANTTRRIFSSPSVAATASPSTPQSTRNQITISVPSSSGYPIPPPAPPSTPVHTPSNSLSGSLDSFLPPFHFSAPISSPTVVEIQPSLIQRSRRSFVSMISTAAEGLSSIFTTNLNKRKRDQVEITKQNIDQTRKKRK